MGVAAAAVAVVMVSSYDTVGQWGNGIVGAAGHQHRHYCRGSLDCRDMGLV